MFNCADFDHSQRNRVVIDNAVCSTATIVKVTPARKSIIFLTWIVGFHLNRENKRLMTMFDKICRLIAPESMGSLLMPYKFSLILTFQLRRLTFLLMAGGSWMVS